MTMYHLQSGIGLNMNNICRICLLEVTNGTSLFSEQESKDILDKIFACFQIILRDEKYWPRVICLQCMEELNGAHNFRLKCITFNDRFVNYCKELQENQNLLLKLSVKKAQMKGSHLETFEKSDKSDNNLVSKESSDCHTPVENLLDLNEEASNFKCKNCNKILKTKASLLKHNICMHQKRKHIGKVTGFGATRRYHCTKCSYSTPHSQTLVNHMRRHNGERPYICECGKTFTQMSSLAAHQKIHSDTTYFTCTICGKQFKHAFTLKTHLQVHDIGKFSCKLCKRILKSAKSLRDHMHRHYNIRNYSCEDCGGTFITASELYNHRKKHDLEKKIECHICGFKTYAKKNLIDHLKRHSGNKAFKCKLCETSFYNNIELRRHHRVHTHEKPYMCPTCSQTFAHSTSVNKHMQTVHGVEFKWGEFKSKERRKIKHTIKEK